MKKIIHLIIIILFVINKSYCFAEPKECIHELSRIENLLFGKVLKNDTELNRITKIEKSLFFTTYPNKDLCTRIENINTFLLGHDTLTENNGYENRETKELSKLEFEDLFFQILNEERSFMGALPLIKDDIALKIAKEQAQNIISLNKPSYFRNQNPPDERYTNEGGTGALIEILKGFELGNGQKIIFNELLIRQLLEALSLNTDDEKILNNPYITHLGYGFGISSDKRKFIVVLDFLTRGGDLESIPLNILPNQKLSISGKLKSPYKFKAITIGYLSENEISEINDNPDVEFDTENLKPYFPPQDHIAYTDTTKSNWIKVLSGLGLLASIGGSPFTGGASTVFAPIFLNSIQNGTAKEIPIKGGVKSYSDGSFKGEFNLNLEGKTGLYFVNVIANIQGSNLPVIVSRRTIRVGI